MDISKEVLTRIVRLLGSALTILETQMEQPTPSSPAKSQKECSICGLTGCQGHRMPGSQPPAKSPCEHPNLGPLSEAGSTGRFCPDCHRWVRVIPESAESGEPCHLTHPHYHKEPWPPHAPAPGRAEAEEASPPRYAPPPIMSAGEWTYWKSKIRELLEKVATLEEMLPVTFESRLCRLEAEALEDGLQSPAVTSLALLCPDCRRWMVVSLPTGPTRGPMTSVPQTAEDSK